MKQKSITISVLFVMASLAFCVYGQENPAIVFSVNGEVKVVPKGSSSGMKCREGMTLNAGDWIKTGANASVILSFDSKADNLIKIEENSLVIIKLDGYFKVQLLRGEINAILENVDKDEIFRVLTPSVVTESLNSGWGASSDGSRTNVVVFDNKVLVCGIDEDGQLKDKKYWIEEGYQRKTLKFEDPGEMQSVPAKIMSWFREQVVAYHLSKIDAREKVDSYTGGVSITDNLLEPDGSVRSSDPGKKEGQEYTTSGNKSDLLEYLYKQRLKQ